MVMVFYTDAFQGFWIICLPEITVNRALQAIRYNALPFRLLYLKCCTFAGSPDPAARWDRMGNKTSKRLIINNESNS